MGMNNRQRRAAKRRQRKPAAGGYGDHRFHRPGAAPSGRRGSEGATPDEVIAAAVDLVWPDAHPVGVAAVDLLADVTSDPAVRGEVSWRLAGWLVRALDDAWARGWQPADLVRVAARDLSEAHGDLCRRAIALEARRYLGSGLVPEPGWIEQLEELDAVSVSGREESLLDDWAGAASRGAFIRQIVELLGRLAHLPDQAVLMPPPGQWSRTARQTVADPSGVDHRVLARVRSLLAKAESTEFPEEAEALSAKAQELIARHAIDRAALAGNASPTAVLGRRIPVENPYPQPKSMLLAKVARANRANAVWSPQFGFSTVFATGDDLASVELLYTSLLSQATAAMLAAGATDRRRRVPAFRESFLEAYALRVGERLMAATSGAVEAGVARHGDQLLPVLSQRSAAVEDATAAAFPNTTSTSVKGRNHSGWVAGQAAAELARLGPATALAETPVAGEPEPANQQLRLLDA